MDVEKVAFVARTGDELYECLRSAAGLGVENIEVGVFLIDVGLPADEGEEESELLEMIDDLEGRVYTTVPADADRFEFVAFRPAEELAGLIRDYDLMAAF